MNKLSCDQIETINNIYQSSTFKLMNIICLPVYNLENHSHFIILPIFLIIPKAAYLGVEFYL